MEARTSVGRATVSDKAKQVEARGLLALCRRKAPGSPAQLTLANKRVLPRVLRRGVLVAGFATELRK